MGRIVPPDLLNGRFGGYTGPMAPHLAHEFTLKESTTHAPDPRSITAIAT